MFCVANIESEWRFDPSSLYSLSDEVAIVTGAASGLGRAIAYGLAECGASVVVADIDSDGADDVADLIGDSAVSKRVDVTKPESVESLREFTLDRYGDYSIVFNIPGTNVRKSVFELSLEDWNRVLEVNLTGMFVCAKVLGRHLVDREDGSVINMASGRASNTGPEQSAYSASKAGVVQLTKVLAAEWAPDVRVNAMSPGYTKTRLVREAMEDEEWYEEMRKQHLLGRFAEPREIVGGAVFLASEASTYATGSVLTIDGGWSA